MEDNLFFKNVNKKKYPNQNRLGSTKFTFTFLTNLINFETTRKLSRNSQETHKWAKRKCAMYKCVN